MSEAAAAGGLLGGLIGYKGNMAAARAAEEAAKYNAQVADNEAEILRRAKVDEERTLRRNARRLIGQQTVATAASGVQMSGSPLQALADAYFQTEQDALRIQYAGDIEETAKAAEAGMAIAEGSARKTALKTQAYTTLLGSASQSANIMGF